jgi:predicted permease
MQNVLLSKICLQAAMILATQVRKIRPEDGAARPAGAVAQAFVPVSFFLEGGAIAELTRNTGKNACATNRSLTRAALFAARIGCPTKPALLCPDRPSEDLPQAFDPGPTRVDLVTSSPCRET